MSYDVDVMGYSFNYTSNMREFFKDFGVYPPDLNGLNRFEVARKITLALGDIVAQDRAELRKKYNSDNGWGNVDGAIHFLEEIRHACLIQMDETVEVSW